jgi:glutamine synthetase
MIRVPLGNERSARIEVRSISPDANPYMLIYTLLHTGLNGPDPAPTEAEKRPRTRILPDNIFAAIRQCKRSEFLAGIFDENTLGKFIDLKRAAAERCPRALGTRIKAGEIIYHHEVTNQMLWNTF